jgi:hypothetical protein
MPTMGSGLYDVAAWEYKSALRIAKFNCGLSTNSAILKLGCRVRELGTMKFTEAAGHVTLSN